MIDTDKYEDAKKIVQDAGLIDENDGHPDIHYRKIAHLQYMVNSYIAEVKRLRGVMIYVEQRQPHPALEWALKEGLTLTEIKERIE